MNNIYKFLLVIFLIPLTINATERKGKYTKTKTLNKEYKVNDNATLNVDNKYGNIVISTWTNNTIEIEVTITTNGNDMDKVEKRLEQIDVEFEGSSNFVSAKTRIEKNTNSWKIWGRNNNVNMQIDYLIKMPITNNLELNNDYGAINIDKLEGRLNLNLDYGKLHIGELWNTENNINIDYTNKSTIDFMKDGYINADYSTLHIEKSGRTKLNADYSHISFGMVTNLDYKCDYGDLKIEDAGNITGNSDYMNTSIDNLRNRGNFDSDYGSIKIYKLGENLKELKVEASYVQVKLGVNNNNSFNIKASLSYGGFKYGDGFTFNKEITKSSSKYYEGFFGSANSNGNIIINTRYGSVTFMNK